ncbi:MAG: helix-turn-helix domain-containing protein [Bradyrhizobium sp.]|nr:helix-turn-helix domain-containing protein [Bradyrhizobium sp.]
MSVNFPNLPAAIQAYADVAGQNYASFARAVGVSKATVTRWKDGEEPEVKRIKKVARILGVSVGYLADEAEVAHNKREARLLAGYRELPEHIRRAMDQLANSRARDATDHKP